MATQYTSILKLALPVTGELSGTWGDVVNNNITSMVEQAIAGLSTINTWTANAHTLTVADGTTSESRCAMLVAATGTGGTALTAAGEIICPAASKLYVLKNGAAYAVTLKTAAGTGVAVPAGDTAFLFCDGTNVNACVTTIVNGHISGNLTVDGNTTLGDANTDTVTVTAQFASDLLPSTDNARDLGSTAKSWRTLYCDTSVLTPLVTATNLQVTNIKANDSTAAITIADSTGAVGISTAVTMSATTQNIALGTSQTTGTFTVGGAAQTGTQTFDQSTKTHTLNLGTGATESGLTKTINLGTAGVSGSTTAITVGSANGTTTTLNGTVTAATLNSTTIDTTNIEVTNIKAKDGTAALSIADSTGVVSVSANPVLSAGTANGVVYLDASKVATSGSALTFDGSKLTVSATSGETALLTATGVSNYLSVKGDTGGTTLWAGFGTDTGLTWVGSVSNHSFSFRQNNTEGMRLVTGGKLNIGGNFTSTNNTLQVTGNAAIGYTTAAPTTGLIVAGNVGVGTDAPRGLLDLNTTRSVKVYFGTAGTLGETQQNAGDYVANNLFVSAESAGTMTYTKTTGDNGNAIIQDFSRGITFYTGVTGAATTTGTLNNFERMRLDSSGNLGLGVTPSAWGVSAGNRALDINAYAGFGTFGGATAVTYNSYFNSSNQAIYKLTGIAAEAYLQTNGQHQWFIAPSGTAGNAITFTQAMTLDASGNLGVGQTSPTTRLEAHSQAAGTQNIATIRSTNVILKIGTTDIGNGEVTYNIFPASNSSTAGAHIWQGGGTERARITSGGDFRVKGAGTAGSTDAFQISGSAPADAARLTSDGNLYVGVVSPATAGKIVADGGDAFYAGTFAQPSSASNCIAVHNRGTSGDNAFVIFGTEAAFTTRGSIDYNRAGGQVRYNTTSDYRAKEVYGPVTDSGAQIDALKVYQGKMIGATQERPMMIAHEAQEVVPYAVGGEKDAVNDDGTPKYQTMDHQILVPLLIAELQSLRARVAQLEGK